MVADIDPAVPSRLPWPGSRHPPRADHLVVIAEHGHQRLIGRQTSVTRFAFPKPGSTRGDSCSATVVTAYFACASAS